MYKRLIHRKRLPKVQKVKTYMHGKLRSILSVFKTWTTIQMWLFEYFLRMNPSSAWAWNWYLNLDSTHSSRRSPLNSISTENCQTWIAFLFFILETVFNKILIQGSLTVFNQISWCSSPDGVIWIGVADLVVRCYIRPTQNMYVTVSLC